MPAKQGHEPQFLYSPAVRVSEGATFGLGTNLTWDAYLRILYNQQNAAFSRIANELLRRGLVTESETRVLIDQRNTLVRETRKPLERFSSELNQRGFTRCPFSDSRSVLAKEAGMDGPSFIA